MATSLSALRSAAVDGRLQNPIFRKAQLQKLHEKLSQSGAEIQSAIVKDTGYTKAEAASEYWLTVRLVKSAYEALDPEASLQAEYRLARGVNAPDGKQPVGIVVIEAARHAYLFSLLSALVPALAAGNCIIVKVQQDMLEAPSLILRLISSALDSDIFLATRDRVTDEMLNHPHVFVLQNGSDEQPPLATQVISNPATRVVAIVERDADLKLAARELVRARFALRGRSPYAPDLVFVNEWVKKNFLSAVVEEVIRLAPQVGDRSQGVSRQLQERLTHERHVNIVSSSATGVVVDIADRSSSLCSEKIETPLLAIHAVRSIDEAIDISNKDGRLGCAYVFAQPAAAKYICQFLDSPLSIVNDVPPKLLFHPMAPRTLNAHSNPFVPYDERLFSLTKAHFISAPRDYDMIEKAMDLGRPELLESLTRQASTLKVFKRADKRPDIGFFEQGIVTGGVMLLSTIVTITGVCCYYWVGLPHGMLLRRM